MRRFIQFQGGVMRSGGRTSHRWLSFIGSLATVIALAGCGSAAPSAGSQPSSQMAAPTPAVKTLRMAMQSSNEPESPAAYGRTGSGSAGQEHFFLFHSNLTALDSHSELIPRIAEKIPSVSDGDWKV